MSATDDTPPEQRTAKTGSGTHCIHGVPRGFLCAGCWPEPKPVEAVAEDVEEIAPLGPRQRPSGLAG